MQFRNPFDELMPRSSPVFALTWVITLEHYRYLRAQGISCARTGSIEIASKNRPDRNSSADLSLSHACGSVLTAYLEGRVQRGECRE